MPVKPIVPWMGGKSKLLKHLLPKISPHKCYVEPFCGGASLFFNKEESKVEVLNDLNGELINLYRVVQSHLEEFCKQFKWILVSRQQFDWMKVTNTETLTDIQRACRFYYLQKTCFGARSVKPTFGTSVARPSSLNLLRLEEDLSNAHLRLARAFIENMDWNRCIEKYDGDDTFFYLDPPYWETTGYGTPFPFQEYESMAKLAKIVKGRMLISINDHPEIRATFSELNFKSLSINYTVGGGKGSPAKELLMWNW